MTLDGAGRRPGEKSERAAHIERPFHMILASIMTPAAFLDLDNCPQLPDYDMLISQIQDQEDNEHDEKHCYDNFAAIPARQHAV